MQLFPKGLFTLFLVIIKNMYLSSTVNVPKSSEVKKCTSLALSSVKEALPFIDVGRANYLRLIFINEGPSPIEVLCWDVAVL